ncbi:MAG: hypothetical protein J6M65_06725 [Eubacterium sp.]|nr:hypothetical protein [Eubacterium sp.]
MNRREFALGKRIKSYELGFVGPLFIAAFPGGMILPFYVYLFGAGVFWEYVGIIICMALVWNYSSYKLMRYAKRHKSICTLPGFLKHRFKDDKDYLRIIMSVETVVLSIIIMSLIIKELGIIIFETFNIDCTIAEFCAAVIPAAIICVFGYSAIAKTAPYKAAFMLAVVVIISVHAYFDQGIRTLVRNMMAMDVTGSVSDYMNVLYHNGRFLAFEDYVSLISMGLLALGMPFMLTTFFSVDNSDKINNGKIIMIVFLPIFFVSAAIMGGISRGYMYPHKLTNSLSGYIRILFSRLCEDGGFGKLLGYMFIAFIILAVVITFEGSLHVSSMIIYEDIIRGGGLIRIRKKNERLVIALITYLVALMCFVISECIEGLTINVIVVFIGTLGCSVAPTVFMTLRWKRMNKYGAMAGLISGMISVPLLKYAALFGESGNKKALCDVLGVNSVVPAMLVSFLMIVLVSLITPKPSEEIQEEYADIKHRMT